MVTQLLGPRVQVELRLRGRGRRARKQVPGWPGWEWVCGGPWCPPAPAQPTLSKKGRMRTATCSSTERRSQGSTRPSSFARPSMASRATRLCGSSPSSSPLIMEVRSWGPWARTWGCITLSCAPRSPSPGDITSQALQATSMHICLGLADHSFTVHPRAPEGLANSSPYQGSQRQCWPGHGAPAAARWHTCPSAGLLGCPAATPEASSPSPHCCSAAGGRGTVTPRGWTRPGQPRLPPLDLPLAVSPPLHCWAVPIPSHHEA